MWSALRLFPTHLLLGVFVLLGALTLWAGSSRNVEAQGAPPPAPVVYSGTVTVGGEPAADGLLIFGRVTKVGVTEPNDSRAQPTKGGKYDLVAVGQTMTDQTYLYGNITFHISGYVIEAAEKEMFLGGPSLRVVNLTFPVLPDPIPAPVPTSVATPVVTPTPVAAVEPIVSSTAVPDPVATIDINAVISAAVQAALDAQEPEAVVVEEKPDINEIVAAAVAQALATETPVQDDESESERSGGVCSRGGSPDLGLIIGGGTLLGLVGRQRFASRDKRMAVK